MAKRKNTKGNLTRSHGWFSLPLSLKIIFVVLCMEIFFGTIRFIQGIFYSSPNFMSALKIVLVIILTVGLYKRYPWIPKYAIVYFIIVLAVLASMFISFIDSALGNALSNYYQMLAITVIISIIFQAMIEALFLFFILRNKKYFTQNKQK